MLGRIVDLETFQAVATLTSVPDEEVTSPASDVVVARLANWQILAFRLSTGAPLWEEMPEAPCRNLQVRGSRIYSGCGNKVLAREIDSGHVTVVDRGPDARKPVLTAHSIVCPHGRGRLDVYDIKSGRRRASRVLPQLARSTHHEVLADPASDGICVLGLSCTSNPCEYRAGCYDEQLISRWSTTVRLPRDLAYDLRQLGPRFAVIDDQSAVFNDSGQPLDQGRGAILRWRDGALTPLDDRTFATVEDSSGERIPAKDDDIFHRARMVGTPTFEGPRRAQVVSDERRAFALIDNRGLALGGVDRATGRTLFVVPIAPAEISDLDIANGLPVIRSRHTDRWVVTVYDASTGKVLYQDSRPPPRLR